MTVIAALLILFSYSIGILIKVINIKNPIIFLTILQKPGVNILPLFELPGGGNLLDPKVKTRKKLDLPKFFLKFSKVNIFP